jgi:hypothetical protein
MAPSIPRAISQRNNKVRDAAASIKGGAPAKLRKRICPALAAAAAAAALAARWIALRD